MHQCLWRTVLLPKSWLSVDQCQTRIQGQLKEGKERVVLLFRQEKGKASTSITMPPSLVNRKRLYS